MESFFGSSQYVIVMIEFLFAEFFEMWEWCVFTFWVTMEFLSAKLPETWEWCASTSWIANSLRVLRSFGAMPWPVLVMVLILFIVCLVVLLIALAGLEEKQDWWESTHFDNLLVVYRCAWRARSFITRILLVTAGSAKFMTDHPVYRIVLNCTAPHVTHPASLLPSPWRAMTELVLPLLVTNRTLLGLGLLVVMGDILLCVARLSFGFASAPTLGRPRWLVGWFSELAGQASWLAAGFYSTRPALWQTAATRLAALAHRLPELLVELDLDGPDVAASLDAIPPGKMLEGARIVAATAFWLGPYLSAPARARHGGETLALVLLVLRGLVIAWHCGQHTQLLTAVITLGLLVLENLQVAWDKGSRGRRPPSRSTSQRGGSEGVGQSEASAKRAAGVGVE